MLTPLIEALRESIRKVALPQRAISSADFSPFLGERKSMRLKAAHDCRLTYCMPFIIGEGRPIDVSEYALREANPLRIPVSVIIWMNVRRGKFREGLFGKSCEIIARGGSLSKHLSSKIFCIFSGG